MRPGLAKPGALPLLALIIFSLLTLVPSLSSIYNIKLADFTFYAGARQVPLIQDSATDVVSEIHPVDPRKSWTLAAQHRPRGNRPSRSSRVGHGAPTIPSEIAPVENKSRVLHSTESSFKFSRRARAFRTYFIQQLDDYQFLTPFTNRSYATENANLPPTLAPSNITPSPTSNLEENPENTPQLSNESTSSYAAPNADSRLQFPTLRNIWQQACHSAIALWEITKDSPYNPALHPSTRTVSKYIESVFWSNASASYAVPSMPQTEKEPAFPTPTQISEKLPCDQPTDAASHHSPELRGSCMAVVIGLVVGIMWF
ncbi:hypothetical protein N7448_003587 [Penicillium atrosanguineum]|uniref:Uncharacterized protein n=1 Tax=Penicillium atrosanguineum TaxID=1132637 RepID=A0A9W9H9H9_9EURO|nr:uncharacterized protein N7443_002556 [Penicillium atrosanguineum]KAJ5122453.1 hypothetical protein N7526_009390 [Penicillium atrosanguineum]KAJ5140179.1 hypothetical protein N7448_003587 [Penicillium atrosanguineum]KAJ5310095.1 hypothetical protein N7443_002556 [Penicillium atrosanguineum]KAJ5315611.1 hypothetical protein N7476_005918 [Penicillium atrosanguineum]